MLAGVGVSDAHRHFDRFKSEPLQQAGLDMRRGRFRYSLRVQRLAAIEVNLTRYKKSVRRADADAAWPNHPRAPRRRTRNARGFVQRQLGDRGYDFFMDAKLSTLAPPPHRAPPLSSRRYRFGV